MSLVRLTLCRVIGSVLASVSIRFLSMIFGKLISSFITAQRRSLQNQLFIIDNFCCPAMFFSMERTWEFVWVTFPVKNTFTHHQVFITQVWTRTANLIHFDRLERDNCIAPKLFFKLDKKPGTFKIQRETVGWGSKPICPFIDNEHIEYFYRSSFFCDSVSTFNSFRKTRLKFEWVGIVSSTFIG